MQPRKTKLIIVILYKEDLDQSPTVKSLVQSRDMLYPTDQVYLWDNSPVAQSAELLKSTAALFICKVQYCHAANNPSLAVAYNEVIKANKDYDLVFFFDQDSGFDQSYFEAIDKAESANPAINLFLPLIYSGGTIVSPGHFFYFKGKYWKGAKTRIVAAKNNVAITSGMAVRMSYLERFGKFEERLQLYGIDTNFMIRYARDNESFYVVKVRFDHDLSDFKEEDKKVKDMRFKEFARSSVINSELFTMPVQWLTRLFLWYRRIQNMLK